MNDSQRKLEKLDIIKVIVIKPIRSYISFWFVDPQAFSTQSQFLIEVFNYTSIR